MKYRIIAVALITTTVAGCFTKKQSAVLSVSPEAGTSYKLGDQIPVSVSVPTDTKADSVQYLVDSVRVLSRKDTLSIKIKTDSMKLGSKLITARVFSGGKPAEVSTNVMLLAPKAPAVYTFKIEKVFPHDTSSYTEGLQYVDGFLYESAGNYGNSSLRKVDLNTGTVVQKAKMDPMYFGEGIAVVGDKIIQLTYKEKKGFVYDKNTFKILSTFNFNWAPEGWGMTYDGKNLLHNDSTNRIWLLNKDTYMPQGYLDVYDDKGPVNQINEMEYIDGKIYANIYTTDTIIVIDPKNGAVVESVDLKNLYPMDSRPYSVKSDPANNVLNGIAWDEKGKRLFVTGKKWDKLFQVKFVKQ
ncbi:glutaminyl-peptide cyclotransferase [Mucilaginibacter paludis]|uniref:Glutamine cyclotransferase n=1 Tax=Mucilaginibacter paludis DSM 18603 TaxID=714943 RepID=H1Y4J6_9SPHI|nr:glutaminyl-peptide cyclotransferase [Mucilaginibacter paludis]EHQ26780.1 glutamine cyclotransferase [Mucilaginibacter paludis DSM 18603]